ncbi:dTDP-4-dehydrorhamnose 3,5-epimerase family protein [Mucilaginibacter aquatilis]|uniref:dTDP-4-dehydrorhamnose 3,5-epimerase n=1 Tax=Mucilaginibacter aquatilis TaxID=1517760 RepID=A0A6I4IC97_9SPHI|nr:dTDP-4-dehydrorhamnose 3,5-epimerase family protein [Mucilaginibacter aquatilis]MVN91196.1 dTDP-4-dehydrorhamnose 3,5-epimerase [Mucilaginibacter aquatilis]
MGTEIISGVYFTPLAPIVTTGGSVMHAIKGLDQDLQQFGECYFSTADSKSPKAWKKHSQMVCNLFVPYGAVKFVFFDDRENSETYGKVVDFTLSRQNYGRLVINPGIWFGFSAISESESVILNIANIKHEPSESIRLDPYDLTIPYKWNFD